MGPPVPLHIHVTWAYIRGTLPDLRMVKFCPGALSALLLLCPFLVTAQTFTGTGADIPDDGNTLNISLGVNGLSGTLNTSTFGLEQVCITINHTYLSDLDVSIVAPDGTVCLLTSGQGGDSDHYTNTCFRSDAATSITAGAPPYTGTYRPQGDMGLINNGQDGNGDWQLRVLDTYPFADEGTVITWAITFGDEPAAPFAFESSNIPIVVINTNGQSIPSDQKITADMGIVDNGPGLLNHPTDPFNNYDGHIGIKRRGNTSDSMSPKKSYTVELRDDAGEDQDWPILGMPEESDWVLLANYFDKSLMNNTLTYHLAEAMGDYAPRQRDVEVVLNGQYIGVYALVEKVKRGADRVDIAKLHSDDISGDQLTGGYILYVDRDAGPDGGFISPYAPAVSGNDQYIYMQYAYPKPEDIVSQQKTYIQAYVDSFETALAGPDFTDPVTGWRAYADEASFVDIFLVNEMSRNVDGYRLSSYLYKDKDSNGGKLHAGPAWDYDIAWGNANYCNGSALAGWAYQFGDICPTDGSQIPFWWSRLQEDSVFVDAVRCRWNELRYNVLSPAYVNAYCDSVAALIDTAQQRNFTVWPILGVPVWPNPTPVPTTYAGEVQELKDFMVGRWLWLDQNLPGSQACSSTVGIADGPAAAIEAPFPNPFTDNVLFRTTTSDAVTLKLVDPIGRVVQEAGPVSGQGMLHRIELPSGLASGTYMLIATTKAGAFSAFRLEH